MKSWIDEGALVAASSDYPVGPYDPMMSVWGLVTRRTGGAGVLGPEQSISREKAIQLYTSDAAKLIGEEDLIGTLEEGKLADFVAYDEDPFTCPVDSLPTLSPVLTVVNGRAVHDPTNIFQ